MHVVSAVLAGGICAALLAMLSFLARTAESMS